MTEESPKKVLSDKEKRDNERYGTELEVHMIDLDKDRPIRVAVIERGDVSLLDIRRMYKKADGSLTFGKGLRICINDGELEDVIILLEGIFGSMEFEDEE